MSVQVVPGEIRAQDATTRAVIPTSSAPEWPPFKRVAETIATPRRRFPPHKHEGVEVLTYVIEGSGTHEFGSDPPWSVQPGSTSLLTAPTAVAHSMNPGKGQTLRWFGILVALPSGATGSVRLQSSRPEASGVQPDGTILRHLVGPGSSITSTIGVECEEIEFRNSGIAFRRVGHDRVAVAYIISGRGQIDGAGVETGEAALAQDAAGVGIQGRAGLKLMFASAPRIR